jgi:hypothetical protein
MMSAPLRQSDFSVIWGDFPQSSSGALPAKTSAAPIPKAKVSTASVRASSSRRSVSSEKSDLVGSLLRTALISELGELMPCSMRWKRSNTPAGRSWFVLQTSEPITNGPGPGSLDAISRKLPTPMAMDGMRDGAGGGSGATYPFRMIIITPRASDMKAGGHGDTGRMGSVRHMLATPRKTDADRGFRGDVLSQLHGYNSRHAGMMPTPLKSDHKGSLGVMSNGKLKSPNVPTYLRDQKWDYARRIAAVLQQANLSGASMTLPVVYGWMMGFPPGWLERALLSAVHEGHLPQVSSSKPTATRSSRKSPKPSAEPS